MWASVSTSGKGSPASLGLPQQLQGLRGAGDAGGHHLPTAKHLVENAAVGGVVVHHQHPHAVQARPARERRLGGLVLGQAEADGEMEAAAPADLALHPDPPAHQADQPRGDGQAQPRSAVPAGRRAVGLLEHLEDRRLFLRRDADARVASR